MSHLEECNSYSRTVVKVSGDKFITFDVIDGGKISDNTELEFTFFNALKLSMLSIIFLILTLNLAFYGVINMSNGKGSAPRPISVPKDVFDNNWERIFGNNKDKEKKKDDKDNKNDK